MLLSAIDKYAIMVQNKESSKNPYFNKSILKAKTSQELVQAIKQAKQGVVQNGEVVKLDKLIEQTLQTAEISGNFAVFEKARKLLRRDVFLLEQERS